MWRFRFANSVNSSVHATVEATAAQVTAAGLEITLDVYGGSKSATWTGPLTGVVYDDMRVWIDVQDAGAPGGWRSRFSGTITTRPSEGSGTITALGDRYHRLKWIPVTRAASTPTDAERVQFLQPSGDPELVSLDAGHAIRVLGAEAQADLPHLVVTKAGVPDAGVTTKRAYKGESIASAMDGLAAAKSGWGWTVRPDDTLYFGPPVTREAVVSTGTRGARVTWTDVVSEGRINAIVWRYELPGDQVVTHESFHPNRGIAGRRAVTRWIDQRSADAVVERSGAAYYTKARADTEQQLPGGDPLELALRGDPPRLNIGVSDYVRTVLAGPAEWVDVAFTVPAGGTATLSTTVNGGTSNATYSADDGDLYVAVTLLRDFGPLDEVRLTDTSATPKVFIHVLSPHRLMGEVLDIAAEKEYVIPESYAGAVSELGLQEPASSVRVQRPGRPDVVVKASGIQHLIREPMRTVYLIDDPATSADAKALRVIVDRKDLDTLNSAAALRTVT